MPTVHIFAAGPSLRNALAFDFNNRTVIGVNGVGLLGAKLDAWCSTDTMPSVVVQWADKYNGDQYCSCVNQHQFPKATCVNHWGSCGPVPIAKVPLQGYYWHGSSAQFACEIARINYKADKIAVWGLDYSTGEHVYDSIAPQMKRSHEDWDMMTLEQTWGWVYQLYRNEGITLVNANPNSGLQAIPKVSPEVAYKGEFEDNRKGNL